ncbi:protein crumbs homolog 1-like isoform X1 [Poecilia formosa]|uniref:protein crumbs homolog 1-like isoform X1 n=1 Tax=Poecilia formosa TaxID=48698 RepID=UPI0007B87E33|nr:PREDICTED: protein crumbs homolog 1-like isoform X1 [Poecilia formosa]
MKMHFTRCGSFDILTWIVFASSLLLIDGASPDKLSQTPDPCLPNPCQNQAICRTRGNGYSCFCVPGFQGAHCQIDVNECASQPCRNGATCVDGVGRFSCLCPPGFTGTTCELQVDQCQSQPCLHHGTCVNHTAGFRCICHVGFQGDRCEIDTDDCQEQPCQNGALCVDGVNEYSCDCSHTAFTGPHCETLLPQCNSDPCFNSAICKDNQGNYTCECWPGFEGRNCEIDMNEIECNSSSPCMNGGRCLERSGQVLYSSEPLLPERYEPAAGYICICPPGTAGSHCQEVVNQCESNPCRNGGRCESLDGGFTCHCLTQARDGVLYGGSNCDVKLVGCEGHECQNGGSCSPFLLDGTHGYTCSCTPGYSGPLCYNPTTFSFERRGYLLLHNPLANADLTCNITLSFKTVLPSALLFQRNIGGLVLQLWLDKGELLLMLWSEKSAREIDILGLPHNVSDGQWHTVQVVLINENLSLRLFDDPGSCGSQSCHTMTPVQTNLTELETSPQDTFIGGSLKNPSSFSRHVGLPVFIGCMRDVFVDWQLVVPEEWLSDSVVNVSPGCSHRDRCRDDPCQNGGRCVNLWQSYECQCTRPYEGHDCEEEHVTARFGNEDSHSFAAFAINNDLGQNLSVSLFLRTRRPNGLLMLLSNSSSPYLHMWLEGGRVKVRLHNSESVKAQRAVHDGEVHFVSVEVLDGLMSLYVAGQKQGDVQGRTVDVSAGDAVFVGGLPEKRSTSEFGGFFKGCIQDLRIGDTRLQFFGPDASLTSHPLEHIQNVIQGCPGDNACSRNPCLNGGICFSGWDDFTCTCPGSTAGRRCDEVKWCELSPCPAPAECKMLQQGYECYSNATFLNDSTVTTYRGNGHIFRNITSLSLNLRTRKRNAAILHAEKGSSFVTVSVQDGLLFMELQSSSGRLSGSEEEQEERREERVSTVSLSSRRSIADGEWHAVHLFMTAPWAQSSRWSLVLDNDIEDASLSKSQGSNLNFLREGVDVYLGGLAPFTGWSLAGCLGTVELGGIALPYFSSSEVNLPRLQVEQFIQKSPNPALPGCRGASVCEPSPCLNGGQCQDLFNTYNCTCAEGWAGRRCDVLVDTCASNPCLHGNCSINGLSYECTCEVGYTGVDCEEQVDVCRNHLCANGATCLHGPDKYACLCAENYTGPLCSERMEELPWYIVVRKITPKLPVSVCGDELRNYTCFNGGNCTDRELSCDCPAGFIGHRCEQDVDECKSNPCLNGGYCRNLVNRFVCVCDMSFAGDVCQTDLTSESLTSNLLLSISLASVLLLLVLILTSVGLVSALNRRATHGTYSPSRQEKDGSRVEMWSITQPPPMERLI